MTLAYREEKEEAREGGVVFGCSPHILDGTSQFLENMSFLDKWKCLLADWFQTRKVAWTFCVIRNAVDQHSFVNKQCNWFGIAGFLLRAQSSNLSAFYGLLHVCSIEDAPKPVPATSEDSRGLCLSAFLGNPSKNWTTSVTAYSCFHQRWLQVSTAVETGNGFACPCMFA